MHDFWYPVRRTHQEYLFMQTRHVIALAASAIFTCAFVGEMHADSGVSNADQVFVDKVSQGGMYEVEASKLAEQRAGSTDLQNVAITEVHDHEAVNKKLKTLAEAASISVAAELNQTFLDRLDKLKGALDDDFDAAYIQDMKEIHDKDEKLFAKEAAEGSGNLKALRMKQI